MNKFVQTSAGDGDYYCYPGRTDPRTIAPECMQYCDPYGCQSQQVCTYPQPPVYHQHGGFQKYRPATASTSQAGNFTVKGNPNKESSVSLAISKVGPIIIIIIKILCKIY